MDLCADLPAAALAAHCPHLLAAEQFIPRFRRRATLLPALRGKKHLYNADRLLNRFIDYQLQLRPIRARFDLFHVADHSYAQLIHVLPAERTGIFCHDLDTFRCLLHPESEPRSALFRAMTRCIMAGFRRAAVVFCATQTMRRRIEQSDLVPAQRLVVAPYGIAPEFIEPPERAAAARVESLLPPEPYLLHVGSCIPRKRIEFLLALTAELRRQLPGIKLVKAGGDWSKMQRKMIEELGLAEAVVPLAPLSRADLAVVYRRAALLLLPSAEEGFGLPLIEALACGTAAVASDLPTLREAAGEHACYCPVESIEHWLQACAALLRGEMCCSSPGARRAWALRYTWEKQAEIFAQAYAELWHRSGGP